MKANMFRCQMCNGVFERGWTDEEAEADMRQTFGRSFDLEDCLAVCDGCYRKVDPANHPHKVEEAVAEQLRRKGDRR